MAEMAQKISSSEMTLTDLEHKGMAQVAARADELGQSARLFQKMAREVYEREQRLKEQVQQLRIEIDEVKKKRQVEEIVDTDYFQELQQKAKDLKQKGRKSDSVGD
jgi:HAMP domain-containing protein